MIEVMVKHTGNVGFTAESRGHVVVCDQPLDNGGADEGMTPPEFFLASLGTCAGFYAAAYLKKKGLEREGLTVRVTADKAKAPARLEDFRIEVDVPGTLSEADVAGMDDAVHRCLIHNTLLRPPKIEVAIAKAEIGV